MDTKKSLQEMAISLAEVKNLPKEIRSQFLETIGNAGRELQIEAALERVRAKAMAMQNSADLPATAAAIFTELKTLGVNPMRSGISIHNRENRKNLLYTATVTPKGHLLSLVGWAILDNHPVLRELYDSWVRKEPYYPELRGELLTSYYEQVEKSFQVPEEQKSQTVQFGFAIPFTHGSLYGWSAEPLDDLQKDLVTRFTSAVDLTFKRYFDLQKAEAQVREAEIEAALERVRATSMAMHNSKELYTVITILAEQLHHLGIDMDAAMINDKGQGSKDWHMWLAIPSGSKEVYTRVEQVHIPYLRSAAFDRNFKAAREGLSIFSDYLTKPQKDLFFKHYFRNSSHRDVPKARQDYILSCPGMTRTTVLNKNSFIQIVRYNKEKFTETERQILGRFGKVFEQSYTRFQDIQKAEAQAREAEIQLALERVRARTMAMHHSDEFPEMANNLYLQVQALGIRAWSAGYCLWEDDAKSYNCCMSSEGVLQIPMVLPSIAVGYDFYTPYMEGKKFHVQELRGAEVKSHYDFMLSLPDFRKNLKEIAEAGFPIPEQQVFHVVYFSHGFLMFITYEPVEDQWEVFKRFGQVFQQTFTRFLDLQKAEAQAREAQIEASLERVRATASSMHKSEDIRLVLGNVFEELRALDINLVRILIWEIDDVKEVITWWSANQEVSDGVSSYEIPYKGHTVSRRYFRAWRKQLPFFKYTITGKEKDSWEEFLFNSTDMRRIPKEVQKGMRSEGTIHTASAINKYGLMMAGSMEPLSEENIGIIKRFGSVFQQSYSRYRDIQKAEAQAREAEIQLALERIRAATMAMHRSEELSEVAAVLFKQVENLGGMPDRMNIGVVRESEKIIEFWSTEQGGEQINKLFKASIEEPTVVSKVFKAWKKGHKTIVIDQTGKELDDWVRYMTNVIQMPFDKKSMGKRRVHSVAMFSQGLLLITTPEPVAEETLELLERFAAVFNQTYTRFLDLQKAEGQAREAQIEAALERVRAKTMAMHKSTDLLGVIKVIAGQLETLGIKYSNVSLGPRTQDGPLKFWLAGYKMDDPFIIDVPYLDNPAPNRVREAQRDGISFFTDILTPEENLEWSRHVIDNSPADLFPDMVRDVMVESPGFARSVFLLKNINLYLGNYKGQPYTDEENNITGRFARVFEQAYARFQDLQKAEAQAREAEIEASLERVRAKTMAMHNTDDIGATVATFFNELLGLGLENHLVCGINILSQSDRGELWAAADGHASERSVYQGFLEMDSHPLLKHSRDSWERGETFSSFTLDGAEVPEYYRVLNDAPDFPVQIDLSDPPETEHYWNFHFRDGYLFSITQIPPPEDIKTTLERFASVFGQTYTRYLDLKKAEKRARESEIEAALERVRARSMGMHKSDELAEIAILIWKELRNLGFPEVFETGFMELAEGNAMQKGWMSNFHGETMEPFNLPMKGDWVLDERFKAWQNRAKLLCQELGGQELHDHVHFCQPTLGSDQVWAMVQEFFSDPTYFYHSYFEYGALVVVSQEKLPPELEQLITRFTRAFEQAYVRFLDLKKAEERARESEIEAALERVRAKTMAMHNTGDIADTVVRFFNELSGLGLDEYLVCGINILSQSERGELWAAMEGFATEETVLQGFLDMTTHPLLQNCVDCWKRGEPSSSYSLEGNEVPEYYKVLNAAPDFPVQLDIENTPQTENHWNVNFADGYLFSITEFALNEEIRGILERFAAAFGQTYTRYLDLKKAEERARESEIEAALERVRARSMAMHKSDELLDLSVVLFQELDKLGIKDFFNCGFVEVDEAGQKQSGWTTMTDGSLGEGYFLPLEGDKVLDNRLQAWKKGEAVFTQKVSDAELEAHMAFVMPTLGSERIREMTLDFPNPTYFHSFNFKQGYLSLISGETLSNEAESILIRFTRAFEQAYIRFQDIQKAEAQARDAVKQASIERVRGEISSMRSAEDLSRITPLVWNELTTLGVPFFRCGVFIVDEKSRKVDTFLSNPKGESLAAWRSDFGLMPLFEQLVSHWKQQEVYITEWDKEDFLEFSKVLMDHGLVDDRERYQSGKDAPEHLVLHLLPFAQGMLYVGSKSQLEPDHMELAEALTAAFSVAYARYDDFKQLEKTLAELKATQAQLIQSEKMASLGELTAGIAHEIKNPLNFVNNFSDVSRELLEELIEELNKGETEEVRALAEDLNQNLEKIVHHGKRADSIVKGMLQHSRSGDGKREPTDINELADEYLRLAYHGLRARDKSFNAAMETEFSQEVGKLDVIPQDIGRVLLNLLTNAFHAAGEKAKVSDAEFEPMVKLKTARENGQVYISVTDNGDGIPERVRDKIFQPFFTTKPTGQGTGLGLSLSYDIVKAHGGGISVKSEAGIGTMFVVELPVPLTE